MKYNIWQIKDVDWKNLGEQKNPYVTLENKINRNSDMAVLPDGRLIVYLDNGEDCYFMLQSSELFEIEILSF